MATAFRLRCSAAGSQEIYFDSMGLSPADAVAARAKISDRTAVEGRVREPEPSDSSMLSTVSVRSGLIDQSAITLKARGLRISTDSPCEAGP
jgi:hypothetical protein